MKIRHRIIISAWLCVWLSGHADRWLASCAQPRAYAQTLPADDRPLDLERSLQPNLSRGPVQRTNFSSESRPEAAYGNTGLMPESSGFTPMPSSSLDPYATPEPWAEPRAGRRRKGGPPSDNAPFNVQSFWMPQSNYSDGVGDYSIYGESLAFGVPISMRDDGMWIATGYLDHYGISTGRTLVNSGLAIPDHLWAVGAGLMRTREFANGWKGGGMFSLGSASDAPFEAARDLTLTSLVYLEVPWGPIDSWKFSLFYSPTAQLSFPLPGVAYVWHPNEAWEINVGLPFAVKYKPNDRFTFTGNYVPLTNVRLMANYDWTPVWSSYAGYMVTNEVFWLSQRTNDAERFFLFDQRLSTGIKRKLGHGFVLDFSVAYVFDRQLILSESFSENRRDALDIDPGVMGLLQLSWYP